MNVQAKTVKTQKYTYPVKVGYDCIAVSKDAI
uniref:Uncharacterized protein n=1 Tax=Setaria italica TaxID=4555 RepID=K3Z2X5_SETIT